MYESFARFLENAPSPYHAVAAVAERLEAAGFTRLAETDPWTAAPGDRQFTVRAGKTVAAWIVGGAPLARAGLRIVGAHTDSPCLKPRLPRVKPAGALGLLELGVYGAPILTSWLDRDLALAGLVLTEDGRTAHLYNSAPTTVRTAGLAIHLDKNGRDNGLKPNPHDGMNAVVSAGAAPTEAALRESVAATLGIAADSIAGLDLCLYDVQPPALTGLDGSLISAARIDNLFSCFCAIEALLRDGPATDPTRMVALFDAEEIGSRTAAGATSPFLQQIVGRLAAITDPAPDAPARAWAHSLFASLDMAHAQHPFHGPALDPSVAPELGRGVALKRSDRGFYAVSAELEARLSTAARAAGIPLQHFRYREDLGGGTSIGPLIASTLGVATVDLGAGMLGMHSIRELAAVADLGHTTDLLERAFFSL